MSGWIALPLLVAIVASLVGASRVELLRSAAAARSLAVLLGAVVTAAVPTLWLLGFGGLAQLGVRLPYLDWCRHLLPQERLVGAGIGLLALLAALIGTIRVGRVVSLHWRLRVTDTCACKIIDTDDVFAYTLPGPAATIALSRGLRDSLEDDEFGVVVAHEEAHARHRHDRFLLIALVTRAFLPPLTSVSRRLEFHIERWADEEALHQSGIARVVAARTIAKVALAGVARPALLGMAHHGTAARAEAMLQPVTVPTAFARLQATATTALIVAVAVLQMLRTASTTAGLVG